MTLFFAGGGGGDSRISVEKRQHTVQKSNKKIAAKLKEIFACDHL